MIAGVGVGIRVSITVISSGIAMGLTSQPSTVAPTNKIFFLKELCTQGVF